MVYNAFNLRMQGEREAENHFCLSNPRGAKRKIQMFYKPKYCCNCGEKIERVDTSITDSGRFCDVCKHDFAVHRAVPKIFVALMAVFGIFGVGSYWRSGEKPLSLATRQFSANPSSTGKNPADNTSQISLNSNAQAASQTGNVPPNPPPALNLTTRPPTKQSASTPASKEETVYFCGAPTKKGTPCSRRVRGGGRCWQHTGQTALLPPEKLAASR